MNTLQLKEIISNYLDEENVSITVPLVKLGISSLMLLKLYEELNTHFGPINIAFSDMPEMSIEQIEDVIGNKSNTPEQNTPCEMAEHYLQWDQT